MRGHGLKNGRNWAIAHRSMNSSLGSSMAAATKPTQPSAPGARRYLVCMPQDVGACLVVIALLKCWISRPSVQRSTPSTRCSKASSLLRRAETQRSSQVMRSPPHRGVALAAEGRARRRSGPPVHDVAGETGAVCIYDGAAAALRLRGTADAETLSFIEEHRAAEQSHLDLFVALLPEPHKHTHAALANLARCGLLARIRAGPRQRSRPVRDGGGRGDLRRRALLRRSRLIRCGSTAAARRELLTLLEGLEHCVADEVHHKDDAAERAGGSSSRMLFEQAWMRVVGVGSAVAAVRTQRWQAACVRISRFRFPSFA